MDAYKRADILTALASPSYDWEEVLKAARSRRCTLQPLHRALLTFLSEKYELAIEWNGHKACVSALVLQAEVGDPLVGQVLSRLGDRAFRWLFGPDIGSQAVGHILAVWARNDPDRLRQLYDSRVSDTCQQGIFLALTWNALIDRNDNAAGAFEGLAKPILMAHGNFSDSTQRGEDHPEYLFIRCVAQCAAVIDPERWSLSLSALARKGFFDFELPEETDWNFEEAFVSAIKSGSEVHAGEWESMQFFNWFRFMCSEPALSDFSGEQSNVDPEIVKRVCLLARPQHDYANLFKSVLIAPPAQLVPVVKAGLCWAYSQDNPSGFASLLDSLLSLSIFLADPDLHEPLVRVVRRHAAYGYASDDSGFKMGQALMRTVGSRQDSVDELFQMASSTNEWYQFAGSAIAYGAVAPSPIREMVWFRLAKRRNKEWVRHHSDFVYYGRSIARYAPSEEAKKIFLSFGSDEWEPEYSIEDNSSMSWEASQLMSSFSRHRSITRSYDISTSLRGFTCMSKTVRERRAKEDQAMEERERYRNG